MLEPPPVFSGCPQLLVRAAYDPVVAVHAGFLAWCRRQKALLETSVDQLHRSFRLLPGFFIYRNLHAPVVSPLGAIGEFRSPDRFAEEVFGRQRVKHRLEYLAASSVIGGCEGALPVL